MDIELATQEYQSHYKEMFGQVFIFSVTIAVSCMFFIDHVFSLFLSSFCVLLLLFISCGI